MTTIFGSGTCPITAGAGTCSDLATPFNGYINYSPYSIGIWQFRALFFLTTNSAVHQPNTVATLTCNPGYTASGTLSSTCSNSAWNPPTLGTCNQGSTGTGMTFAFYFCFMRFTFFTRILHVLTVVAS